MRFPRAAPPDERAVLVIVDVQEAFAKPGVVPDFPKVAANCDYLVRIWEALELPVLLTEQAPDKLGETVAPIRGRVDKLVSSGMGALIPKSEFGASIHTMGFIQSSDIKTVVIAGLEAHICVTLLARDLLAAGVQVYVAVDAIASHDAADKEAAIMRMRDMGATMTTVEGIAYELVEDCRKREFKPVSTIIKERRAAAAGVGAAAAGAAAGGATAAASARGAGSEPAGEGAAQ